MKKVIVLAAIIPTTLFAQVNVGGTINDKANEKTGEVIDNVWNAPGKSKEKKNQKENTPTDDTSAGSQTQQQNPVQSGGNDQPTIKTYQNYDFVAGSELIFSDDFLADQDGEFPAHWELESGQGVVNTIGDKRVMALTDGNYAKVYPRVVPNNYLDEHAWTIELDFIVQSGYDLRLFFSTAEGEVMDLQTDAEAYNADFPKTDGSTEYSWLQGAVPEAERGNAYYNKWHHLAIAYKEGQMKVYLNQNRILVVPNVHCKPTRLTLGGIASQESPLIFTNVRIANGGNQNMLNALNTNGKIVSYGITFDSGKSDIKPESMGTMNEIAKMMKDNPALKLEIGGHTDSDGEDASNMTLSQKRAEAVKTQLVAMGIDGSRLTVKGYGETKPVAKNDSFEGKAKNRRVEFVKQ